MSPNKTRKRLKAKRHDVAAGKHPATLQVNLGPAMTAAEFHERLGAAMSLASMLARAGQELAGRYAGQAQVTDELRRARALAATLEAAYHLAETFRA